MTDFIIKCAALGILFCLYVNVMRSILDLETFIVKKFRERSIKNEAGND